MVTRPETLVELKSMKAQLEVGLIYLKRRHTELQHQLEAVQQQRAQGQVHRDAFIQLQNKVQDYTIQIERRKHDIQEIDTRIQYLQAPVEANGPGTLSGEHDQVCAEIAAAREEILARLRALAEPLRRYEALVERKTQLYRSLATQTGKDLSYAHYIQSALLRQVEYVDDVKYSVETIKKQRVVA